MAERVKLSKRSVDALAPMSRSYVVWDTEIPGFGVRVSPQGKRSFLLRYRVGGGRGGRSREPVIGTYGELTPDEARKIARSWAAKAAAGEDPGGVRQAAREAPRMSVLLDRYLEEHAYVHKKAVSAREDKRAIEGVIRPALGMVKVA